MRQVVRQRVFDVRVRVAHASLSGAVIVAVLVIKPYGTTPKGITLSSILLAWALFWAIRGARSATILLTDSMLRVRTLGYTKSWPVAQVEAIVTGTRAAIPGFGWLGFGLSMGLLWLVQRPRRILGIKLRGGATLWVTEFKSRPLGEGEHTWVDKQADVLNNALRHEARTTGPSA
jgi:hypothetical protein